MKLLKQWWSSGGGLLHLSLLLSLAGIHVDLDFYLLLPPPTLLRDELLPLGSQTRSPYALSLFQDLGGWGRASQLHPKGQEPGPMAPLEGQLLREVRALWVPFIPRTRVDAWLVHSVADRDADGTHGLFGTASLAGGVGASVDGGDQATPGGGGDPRATRHSPLAAAEEETAAAERTAQVPDAGGRMSQENEILREKSEAVDPSAQHEENEERVSAQQGKLLQESNEGKNKIDKADWEAEKTTESRSEIHLNWTDTSLSLEDFFQLLSSQPEYSPEGITLEDIPPLPSSVNDGMNPTHYNVNLSQAVNHDVNLHEAMFLCPNNTFRRDPVARTSQAQAPFLQLNSHSNPEQALPGTNLTGFPPAIDNQMRNLTSQDLLYDLDANIFDDINLMSLTTGFNPLEVSRLFEEPDSDSGLSLNSSHNSTSIIKSNSSHSTSDEGAVGYSSDPEHLSHCDLEGAVGGSYPEPSNPCHVDHKNESGFQGDLAFQFIFHDHTYHFQPGTPEPTSQSFSWPGKSQRMCKYLDDTDRNLSCDEQRAKALCIPFTVDEIVHMPVDSFNSILSRYYLTDLQVSLVRDIRRRGKNKVAAQNCRKRKLDVILNLEEDVCNLQAKKETLESEQAQCNKAIDLIKQKLHDLYHDVFSRLRDDQGRPVNPNQYALQCSNDGTVLIVPKELVMTGHKKETQKRKRKRERRN